MSTAVSLIRAEGLHASVPYAYAASVAEGARLVFLAGSCPIDADGRTVAVGDHAGQARACVQNMMAALAAAGATVGDVVFVRVLVASTERADLSTAWNVVHDALSEHEAPATLMGVTVLGWPDQLVEVEAVAALLD